VRNNNCICNLLKYISVLQDNSTNMCNFNCYNTRVISIYKKNGDLFTTNYGNNDNQFFRVMNVSDNCVTLLVLVCINGCYRSTKQFITVNLDCICAVKCIKDVNIKIL